jgi:hypothetical protein
MTPLTWRGCARCSYAVALTAGRAVLTIREPYPGGRRKWLVAGRIENTVNCGSRRQAAMTGGAGVCSMLAGLR